MNVRYSILIPTHDRLESLRNALECALGQSYDGDYEVLVCDDGSADGTWRYLQGLSDPHLRILRNEENLRGIRTRNRLVREAVGDYVVWLDDDDLIQRDFLKCAETVLESKTYDIVDFNYLVLDQDGRKIDHPWSYFEHVGDNCLPVVFGLKKCGGWILWGKAIRREVMLRSLPGEIDFYFDDQFYVIPMYYFAKSYIAPETSSPLYQYNYGTGLSFVFGPGVSLERFKSVVESRYAAIRYNESFLRRIGCGDGHVRAVVNGQDLGSLVRILMNIESQEERAEAYEYLQGFFSIGVEMK